MEKCGRRVAEELICRHLHRIVLGPGARRSPDAGPPVRVAGRRQGLAAPQRRPHAVKGPRKVAAPQPPGIDSQLMSVGNGKRPVTELGWQLRRRPHRTPMSPVVGRPMFYPQASADAADRADPSDPQGSRVRGKDRFRPGRRGRLAARTGATEEEPLLGEAGGEGAAVTRLQVGQGHGEVVLDLQGRRGRVRHADAQHRVAPPLAQAEELHVVLPRN